MNKIRCFLAIKVENVYQYQKRINSISTDLDIKLNVVDPIKYHFTLHFFGDLEEIDIKKANTIFESMNFQEFKIILNGPGSLPNNKLKHTRVLYIEPSEGKNKIVELIWEIRKILGQNLFKIEKRKPIPHLTVCRVRKGLDIEKMSHEWLASNFEPIIFRCSSLVFVKSEITQTGVKYSPMYEYPLYTHDVEQ
ncbi:MAG: RNA 2',3'-cyclic phosphodiesterase [Candidatus Heimdallarchaeota archaeon LC_2]|nr:MAG: RNA 2',3'-cyclic phosphodiesterase [Candidatus Heimdallarchaeota archaeon LC_2]